MLHWNLTSAMKLLNSCASGSGGIVQLHDQVLESLEETRPDDMDAGLDFLVQGPQYQIIDSK